MSQFSKVQHSRQQWKHKATQRGDHNRSQRKQIARLTTARNQATRALKETRAQLRQLESQSRQLVVRPKVDLVHWALQLFLVARIAFRAVCRVLSLLPPALGINTHPCPQPTTIWVPHLTLLGIEAPRTLKSFPPSRPP